MTEKEKEAIENLKSLKEFKQTYYSYIGLKVDVKADEEIKDTVNTILNLIEKQQEEINKLTKQNKNLDKEAQAYLEELAGDSGMKERTINYLQNKLEEVKNVNLKIEQELEYKNKLITQMIIGLINTRRLLWNV